MGHGGEGTALDGCPLRTAVIPEYNFPGIGASQDEIRMESCEAAGKNRRLAMKDILGCGFLKASIPNETDAIRIMR